MQFNDSFKYENIVIIPAIGEFDNFIKLLSSLSKCNSKYFDNTLILFVINNTHTSSAEVKKDNQKSIELFKKYH